MKCLVGIAASPGVADGTAFLYPANRRPVPTYSIAETDVTAEISRFRGAVERAERESRAVRTRLQTDAGREEVALIDVHLLMLTDPTIANRVGELIAKSRHNAEWAATEAFAELSARLEHIDDEYLRARTDDLDGVLARILHHIGDETPPIDTGSADSILVAESMLPADVFAVEGKPGAIVLESGGWASHTAIIARGWGIPAVVGLEGALEDISVLDRVIVDGTDGIVIVDPDAETIARYEELSRGIKAETRALEELRNCPARTADGTALQLHANIDVPEEASAATAWGADGIGLFRSELLFIEARVQPDEEAQLQAYRSVVRELDGRPVVIRTLDVGGDKFVPGLDLPLEHNPMLGLRALRACLRHEDLFRRQIRAIVRAADDGDVRILLPMVTTCEELVAARRIVDEVQEELVSTGAVREKQVPVGAMVEVPAAALIADRLVRSADFLSIGTNDLIQYALAVDRSNEHVAGLYQQLHPAILELLAKVVAAGRAAATPVAICGEMAGDPLALPLLVGLGLRTLSMAAPSIARVKQRLAAFTVEAAETLAARAMQAETAGEVGEMVDIWLREHEQV